jgi:hypothetical protein
MPLLAPVASTAFRFGRIRCKAGIAARHLGAGLRPSELPLSVEERLPGSLLAECTYEERLHRRLR